MLKLIVISLEIECMINSIFSLFSVVFIIIGVGIYGSKIKDIYYKLGWSFGVTIAGAVLAAVAGIAEVIVLLK